MVTGNDLTIPRLLTAQELSARTGLAYWRLLQLVKQGKGPPCFYVGNTLRFPEDEVLRWIREQQSPNGTEE